MIDCPICHVSNEDEARFCAECGQRLGPVTQPAGSPLMSEPTIQTPPPVKGPGGQKLTSPFFSREPEGYQEPDVSRLRNSGDQPASPGRASKGLRSPLLGGGIAEDQEAPGALPHRRRRADDQIADANRLSGHRKTSHEGGSLRSPLLGGATPNIDEEPAPPAPRAGRKTGSLRSPLLGAEPGEFDDYTAEDSPHAGGSLHSPILGTGRASSARFSRLLNEAGGSFAEDYYYEEEEEPSEEQHNVLRSPLLGAKVPLHERSSSKSTGHKPAQPEAQAPAGPWAGQLASLHGHNAPSPPAVPMAVEAPSAQQTAPPVPQLGQQPASPVAYTPVPGGAAAHTLPFAVEQSRGGAAHQSGAEFPATGLAPIQGPTAVSSGVPEAPYTPPTPTLSAAISHSAITPPSIPSFPDPSQVHPMPLGQESSVVEQRAPDAESPSSDSMEWQSTPSAGKDEWQGATDWPSTSSCPLVSTSSVNPIETYPDFPSQWVSRGQSLDSNAPNSTAAHGAESVSSPLPQMVPFKPAAATPPPDTVTQPPVMAQPATPQAVASPVWQGPPSAPQPPLSTPAEVRAKAPEEETAEAQTTSGGRKRFTPRALAAYQDEEDVGSQSAFTRDRPAGFERQSPAAGQPSAFAGLLKLMPVALSFALIARIWWVSQYLQPQYLTPQFLLDQLGYMIVVVCLIVVCMDVSNK